MVGRQRIYPAAVLAALLMTALVSGCETKGPTTPTTNVPPTTSVPPTTATLRVIILSNANRCADHGGINIFIDGTLAGTLNPGGSVSRTVSIGAHTVLGTSVDTKVDFPPVTVTVPVNGVAFASDCRETM